MAIRALSAETAEDGPLYREIRLAALRSDPAAFASSLEREEGFDDATWRSRLAGFGDRPGQVFVDELDGEAIGTVAVGYTEWDPVPMLVAMWVRPEARGVGAGRRLVAAAVDWAIARGERELVLWVMRDNTVAIELYRSCGFTESGAVDTAPDNPCAEELEMRRPLSEP